MCGIAGAAGAIDERIVAGIRAATRAQRHRGPDAEGFWSSPPGEADRGGAVLGHRRLAIIDLSEDGNEPVVDAGSGVVLVYNGEVYNFRELRAELEGCGARFVSRCDAEVVLRAYLHWGADCVQRLRGMFAFAIYDPRSDEVVLARDRLGVKPLYVARARSDGRTTWLFSSEVRALLDSGLVERRLSDAGLLGFLWHGFVPGPDTLVEGVQRLEPGSVWRIHCGTGEVATERYWTLPGAGKDPCVEGLRDELERAVAMRLVADVPLGIFLSGGIDSSAMTALAVRSAGSGVRTFNVGFEETAYDESAHARAIAAALGTDHVELCLSEQAFIADLDSALSGLDQPTFDAINSYFVSRAVREAGVTVALAGTGGDELFGGYGSFRQIPRLQSLAGAASLLPAPARHAIAGLAARIAQGPPGPVPAQTRWGKLADMLDAPDLLARYQLSYAIFLPAFQARLAGERAVDALEWGLSRPRAAYLRERIRGAPALHAISTLELASFVGERLLPDTDAASMAVSLEVRVPLLDHRVVEATAHVAQRRRFRPLGRKALLRELALGDLPGGLFERPKAGFELPLERWCREGLSDRVEEMLLDGPACAAAGLQPRAVAALWSAFRSGAPGLYWSRVWALFVLLWWCSRHGLSVR